MRKIRYILVADAGMAKLFKQQPNSQHIELVHSQENPGGRKMAAELSSDRPGSMPSGRGGHHSLGGDQDPQRHEAETFAATLGRLLKFAHQDGQFDELMIAAPPQFLGELRQHLSEDCHKALVKTLNKDLLRLNEREILERFS